MPNLSTMALGAGTATRQITPDDQKRLYAETDARFAAQTGITHKLDSRAWVDQAWLPVWTDLYGKVAASFRDGTLVWTYSHPDVAGQLATAVNHAADAATALLGIVTSPTPADAAPHAAIADVAQKGITQASVQAASTIAALEAAAKRAMGSVRGMFGSPSAPAPTVSGDLAAKAHADVAQGVAAGAAGAGPKIATPQEALAAVRSGDAAKQASAIEQVTGGGSPTANRTLKIAAICVGGLALVALGASVMGGSKSRSGGGSRRSSSSSSSSSSRARRGGYLRVA